MQKPHTVTSLANPLLKDVRRAIARGSLTGDGCCVAETFHLLDEALASGCEVKTVLAAESALDAVEARAPRARVTVLPDAIFARLADTATSQGVIALVTPPAWRLEQLFAPPALLVLLDGVQDPGNAGTIVRTAEAFGATGVLFLKGTVSPFNAKTLRAAAGSLFRVPFAAGLEAGEVWEALDRRGVTLYAGLPARGGGGQPLAGTDFRVPCAIVVGSEGHGVSAALERRAAGVSIPTVAVESLNAAVAAGILLYEARRQRGAPA